MMTAQNRLTLSHQVAITEKIISCISNLENHHVNKWVFEDKVGTARLVYKEMLAWNPSTQERESGRQRLGGWTEMHTKNLSQKRRKVK